MTVIARALAWGATAARRAREGVSSELQVSTESLLGLGWFVVSFGAVLWVWGVKPLALAMPDEAVNRLAAELLKHGWRPFLDLPHADPEDLAHPRHWVSVGHRAMPAYAPFTFYFDSLLLRMGRLGLLLHAALPATGVAAFVMGTARLLPAPRRWLALLAPLLGFPALYWLLRPWMNVSLLLTCLCWAVYCWVVWRQSDSQRHFGLAMACVGAAAAVRPDYAAYLFTTALLLCLAAKPASFKQVVVAILLAGLGAVAVNLLLNWAITGHPLRAAYQIIIARRDSAQQPSGSLDVLRQLLLPMGAQPPRLALDFLERYLLDMGPIAGLTLLQLSLIPFLAKKPRFEAGLWILALVVMAAFIYSHMDPDLSGAHEATADLQHSMPRYWTPIYLLAALPPILVLGACRDVKVFTVGACLLVVLALASGYDLVWRSRLSLVALNEFEHRSTKLIHILERQIPRSATVYSESHDKILWAKWRVGTIDETSPSAASIHRAFKAGGEVYVFEPWRSPRPPAALDEALRRSGLKLERQWPRGLYRVVADDEKP